MLGLRKRSRASIPTPVAGSVYLTVDTDGLLVFKKEDGSVVAPETLISELAATVAGKQDAASAATDVEVSAAIATVTAAVGTETTRAEGAEAAALPKAGGTMTGALTLSGDPTQNLHAATRQFVTAQIAALVNGAPGTLDTLKEIADKLGADETVAEALASTVAGKLGAAANLSDIANAATARANLAAASSTALTAEEARAKGTQTVTRSLTEFGAVSGQDATAAFEAAMAAVGSGDVLLIPRGTFKLGASAGGLGVPDGVRIVGVGRKASIIECNYAGTARVKMFAPIGTASFSDIGFRLAPTVDRSAEVQAIFGRETATSITLERFEFLGGFAICVDAWLDKTTDITLRDGVIDGESQGLASGANRKVVMGLAHNGAGVIRIDGITFRRLGSNAADKPFASHCIYIAPTANLLATKCVFEGHIHGRCIQFYEGFAEVPPTPVAQHNVIRDSYFRAYNPVVNPFSVAETSEKVPTSYVDCDFAEQATTSGVTVVVKGKARFPGTRFAGASVLSSAYLGDPEGEFTATSSPDPAGAYFGESKAGEESRDVFSGLPSPLLAQSCDPLLATNGITPNANTNCMAKVYVPVEKPVSKMLIEVIGAGSGLTAGKNELGLYSVKTGKLIARTADQSTAWTTTGEKEPTLVAEPEQSLKLPPGYYYLAVVANGTTRPTFTRISTGSGTATTVNAGQPAALPRAATGGVTAERLASTLGTPTAAVSLVWMGLKE